MGQVKRKHISSEKCIKIQTRGDKFINTAFWKQRKKIGANQWTGFYMISASVMKGLTRFSLLVNYAKVFIKI